MQFADYLVIGAEIFLALVVIIGCIFEKHVIREEIVLFLRAKRTIMRFKRSILRFYHKICFSIAEKLRNSEKFMNWLYDEKPSISQELEADYICKVRIIKGWQNVPSDYVQKGLQNIK
jgi:hypothetical protein